MTWFTDRLELMGYNTYEEYLASPHWGEFKRAYARSGLPRTCMVCGSPHYQLHHTTYARLGSEELRDVLPLCRYHHTAVHQWLEGKGRPLSHTRKAIQALKQELPARQDKKKRQEKLNKKRIKRRKRRKKEERPVEVKKSQTPVPHQQIWAAKVLMDFQRGLKGRPGRVIHLEIRMGDRKE